MAHIVAVTPASLREEGCKAYIDQEDRHAQIKLERRFGGVLVDHDAAADLDDRLQRQLNARQVARH